MTYSIASFYDLKVAVAALAAAGTEDNTPVALEVQVATLDGDRVVTDELLTSISLERGTRQEVVLR